MRRKPSLICLAAASLTLAGAGAVFAQQGPAPHPGMREASPDMQARHAAMENQRAQDLRIVLRLRPDQEPALTAFLAAHRHPDGRMGDGKMGDHKGPPDAMTTPQRLDEMAQRETRMAAERQKHVDALKAFYAALSPEQRQVFDALQRMHGPGGPDEGMHGMHGMHGHGWGGPPPGGMGPGGMGPGGPPPE